MRGKQWSVDDERQLSRLVEGGRNSEEISRIMGKSRSSVRAKLFNLGLNSVVVTARVGSAAVAAAATTPLAPDAFHAPAFGSASVGVVDDLKLPEQLPSVEEELKILAGAVEALRQPGLSRADVSRLHNIIEGVKVYQELFVKYVHYKELEMEVVELRRQFASENTKK